MKSEIVVFILCVIVVAGIGSTAAGVNPFQSWRLPVPELQPMSVQASPPAIPPANRQVQKPAKPTVATPPALPDPVVAETPAPVQVVAPERPAIVPPVAVGDVKPFPLPEQIANGATKVSITDRFGAPSMFTTATENGRLVETYVYARSNGAPTVIRFEDGKVILH